LYVRVQFFFFGGGAQQPLVGQSLLTVQAPRSHSDTPHSVGILWASDQPDTENSDNAQHSQETFTSPARFESAISNKQVAVDPRLRPRGHWNRHWHY